MGEQRNLTEENVEELRARLKRMQQDNPDLEYRFFQQNEITKSNALNTITIVKEIREKVNSLECKLDLIFDGHVLIDGAF